MKLTVFSKTFLIVLGILITSVLSAQKSVLTQHNNIDRTGWYDNETVLNKSNVHAGSFGKIFTRAVDDQIYAQPLVKLNLNIPNKGNKNVVFVCTVNNSVYAFDADSANVTTPYWQINLTPAKSRVINRNDETGACGGFYRDFSCNMGIVGTPVIDSSTNIMYVVARSVDTTGGTKTFKQYLHALDITTGADVKTPVLIVASVDGTGDGSVNGKVSFNALHNNQRGGLLLLKGVVYIVWSSHCDWGPYHGWLIGYDKTSLQQKYVYASTPDGYNGGIWMSGGGPSADENGNVYLAVGNGSVGANGDPTNLRNRSESALKLMPSGSGFTIKSYFTPKNFETLEGADLDFGVTQIMLIPNTNRAIVGVKDGHIYLMNRDTMGGYSSVKDNVIQTIDLGSNSFLRSSMSYYKGSKEYLYSWSENSLLRAYPYNRTTNQLDLNNTIVSGLQGPTGNNGALLSVSSNQSVDSTGILWASYAANGDANQSVRPGILRAIDASDVTKELWNSSVNANDNPGNYAKFNCPTIANGKVYLATFSNQLVVYGLTGNSADSCGTTDVALNKPAVASSIEAAGYEAGKAFDGNLITRWSSEYSDPQNIYVDLGKRYDLCNVVLHWEVALGENFK
ncbi:MAG TPA: discoidin domain-containing protein, partial [Parafilimonas sp.]